MSPYVLPWKRAFEKYKYKYKYKYESTDEAKLDLLAHSAIFPDVWQVERAFLSHRDSGLDVSRAVAIRRLDWPQVLVLRCRCTASQSVVLIDINWIQ